MNVITIEEKSFYLLIDKVLEEFEHKFGKKEPEWLQEKEAMQLLGIRSKTTLQKLRDTSAIRYTQPRHKIIMYHRCSLLDYLEEHANK